ncbi:MAG TPA: UDP-glucose/GDP-mannose dehydrogenase family protein, partial [Candidatus Eisenbacteria bacterium]|nr:UDP-glucose/GDP-mannose dehydrogenase family protein [Candidatus Eisenbacteria bacterium]
MHSITVVGTGYVGLVTGACLADFGNNVTCVDTDAGKIERLRALELPFFEPGLPEIVQRNVQDGRLRFESDLVKTLKGSPVVFITVGTPPRKDGSADTRAIYDVAKTVAQHLDGYTLVVQKSTAPVGTARSLYAWMARFARRGARFDVASNPEFLREGSAIETFMRPDRVVIGAESKRAADILTRIHDPLFLIETPKVVTTLESAELIKYASNAFLATKISFINEVANLCESLGADVQSVAKGMGMDRRIGSKFLHAGPGYGGSCFPKDTQALSSFARAAGARMGIVDATVETNARQHARMVDKIVEAIGRAPRGACVAVLGLAFKPNTDDLREAPALAIIEGLRRRGVRVRAYDPVAGPKASTTPELKGVTFATDAYDCARGADAVAIVTEWNEFRNLDLKKLHRIMRRPVLCDLRNLYEPDQVEAAGLRFVGVGRGRPAGARHADTAARDGG